MVAQAGQVWFPDSSYKTSEAIKYFHREQLPIIIFANWRGFSGGLKGEPSPHWSAYLVRSRRHQPVISLHVNSCMVHSLFVCFSRHVRHDTKVWLVHRRRPEKVQTADHDLHPSLWGAERRSLGRDRHEHQHRMHWDVRWHRLQVGGP